MFDAKHCFCRRTDLCILPEIIPFIFAHIVLIIKCFLQYYNAITINKRVKYVGEKIWKNIKL